MNFNDFQKKATRTLDAENMGYIKSLMNCGFGITGETGEVVDILKKHLFHGHPLDQDKLKEELGDVLWYVSCIAYLTDISLQDVAEHNIVKLLERYPRGFDTKSSVERVDKVSDARNTRSVIFKEAPPVASVDDFRVALERVIQMLDGGGKHE